MPLMLSSYRTHYFFFYFLLPPPRPTLFPYTTLFRSIKPTTHHIGVWKRIFPRHIVPSQLKDRKSTRLNSSHANISYAVFCLKKKKNKQCANKNYSVDS